MKSGEGFNLIGLVATLAILAVLAAFTLIELDPAGKINQANDQKRLQDILLISQALDDYLKDHQGQLPDNIVLNTNKKVPCTNFSYLNCADSTNIGCAVFDNQGDFLTNYLEDLPIAPDKTGTSDTGYYLQLDNNNHIVVGACSVSGSDAITYTTVLTAVPTVYTCASFDGYEFDGHCWVKAAAANKNCTTVCQEAGTTCENNVSMANWANCTVFNNLSGGTCTTCTIYNGSTSYPHRPAFLNSSYPTACYVKQNMNIGCSNTPNASYRQVCPCIVP